MTLCHLHLRGLAHDEAEEVGSAEQDLRDLRPPVRVAEEVGTQLGRGEVLLGSLPENEVMSRRDAEKEGVANLSSGRFRP